MGGSALPRAAMAYAERLRWPVLPLKPRGKIPNGRLAPRGHRSASCDIATIARWWWSSPSANIGVACTPASGIVALDIDPRNGGDESLEDLIDEYGALPETVEAITGGGGRHILFSQPEGIRFSSALAPGIDVKGDGYIVVAPSVHGSGVTYAWEHSSHPLFTGLAELPGWVISRAARLDRQLSAPTADVGDSLLALAFAEAGMMGRRIDAVRVCVECPWSQEHSTRSTDSATVLFAPRDRAPHGSFHCSHEHCRGRRKTADVLAMLPSDAVYRASCTLMTAVVEVEL